MKSLKLMAFYMSVVILPAGCQSLEQHGHETGKCGSISWVQKNIEAGKTTYDQLIEMCGEPYSYTRKLADGSVQLDYFMLENQRAVHPAAGSVVRGIGSIGLSVLNVAGRLSSLPVAGIVRDSYETVGAVVDDRSNRGNLSINTDKVRGVSVYIRNGKVVRYAANNPEEILKNRKTGQ